MSQVAKTRIALANVAQIKNPDYGPEPDGKDRGAKEQCCPKQTLLETIHLQAGVGHMIASEHSLTMNLNAEVGSARDHALACPSISDDFLAWPEPTEGSGGEESVDKAVDHFFNGETPGLSLPYRVTDRAKPVGKERGGSDDTEHG